MNESIIARREWVKSIPGAEYGSKLPVTLTVTGQLLKLKGNDYPYFSLTYSIKSPDRRLRDPYLAGGCNPELILSHFPECAPLDVVHLSGADGVPMHAEANARYWAGLTKWEELNLPHLASHLQVSEAVALEVKAGLDKGLPWQTITSTLGLVELWSNQAGAARKLLSEAI